VQSPTLPVAVPDAAPPVKDLEEIAEVPAQLGVGEGLYRTQVLDSGSSLADQFGHRLEASSAWRPQSSLAQNSFASELRINQLHGKPVGGQLGLGDPLAFSKDTELVAKEVSVEAEVEKLVSHMGRLATEDTCALLLEVARIVDKRFMRSSEKTTSAAKLTELRVTSLERTMRDQGGHDEICNDRGDWSSKLSCCQREIETLTNQQRQIMTRLGADSGAVSESNLLALRRELEKEVRTSVTRSHDTLLNEMRNEMREETNKLEGALTRLSTDVEQQLHSERREQLFLTRALEQEINKDRERGNLMQEAFLATCGRIKEFEDHISNRAREPALMQERFDALRSDVDALRKTCDIASRDQGKHREIASEVSEIRNAVRELANFSFGQGDRLEKLGMSVEERAAEWSRLANGAARTPPPIPSAAQPAIADGSVAARFLLESTIPSVSSVPSKSQLESADRVLAESASAKPGLSWRSNPRARSPLREALSQLENPTVSTLLGGEASSKASGLLGDSLLQKFSTPRGDDSQSKLGLLGVAAPLPRSALRGDLLATPSTFSSFDATASSPISTVKCEAVVPKPALLSVDFVASPRFRLLSGEQAE